MHKGIKELKSKKPIKEIVDVNKIKYWLDEDILILFRKFFTETGIDKAIIDSKIDLMHVTTTEDFEHEPYQKKAELVSDWHASYVERHMFRVGKDWTTTDLAKVRTYRIPSNYSSLYTGKLVRELLKNKLTWFKKFSWEIYEPKDSWYIFLNNNKGNHPIYLTLDTLLGADKNVIIKDNNDYWDSYCGLGTGSNYSTQIQEHNKNAAIINRAGQKNMFNTPIAKRFFQYLNTLPNAKLTFMESQAFEKMARDIKDKNNKDKTN